MEGRRREKTKPRDRHLKLVASATAPLTEEEEFHRSQEESPEEARIRANFASRITGRGNTAENNPKIDMESKKPEKIKPKEPEATPQEKLAPVRLGRTNREKKRTETRPEKAINEIHSNIDKGLKTDKEELEDQLEWAKTQRKRTLNWTRKNRDSKNENLIKRADEAVDRLEEFRQKIEAALGEIRPSAEAPQSQEGTSSAPEETPATTETESDVSQPNDKSIGDSVSTNSPEIETENPTGEEMWSEQNEKELEVLLYKTEELKKQIRELEQNLKNATEREKSFSFKIERFFKKGFGPLWPEISIDENGSQEIKEELAALKNELDDLDEKIKSEQEKKDSSAQSPQDTPDTETEDNLDETKEAPTSPGVSLRTIEKRLTKKSKEESNHDGSENRDARAEKEVADFFAEMRLEDLLTPSFEQLSSAQKLLVVRGLKNRIVDMVSENAKTQYSEDMTTKRGLGKILSGITKEWTVKKLEAEVFGRLLSSPEGKQQISSDLDILITSTRERDVTINDGKPEIVFIPITENQSPQQQSNARIYNAAANKFREVPYEHGQEPRGKNRREYDKAKAQYEEALNLMIDSVEDASKMNKALAVMMTLDSQIQMDQLLNTHPEVEQEFQKMSQTPGGREAVQTGSNLLRTMTGGKNLSGKALFAGGIALRMATASLGLATGLMAPIVTGSFVGGIRGWLKGKETLQQRKIDARHGKKDTNKTHEIVVDSNHLIKQLKKLTDKFDSANPDGNATNTGRNGKVSSADQLKVRIDHMMGKMERGEVNFGDAKSSLKNQAELIFALNNAIALSFAHDTQNSEIIIEKLNSISGSINNRINSEQNNFKLKQAVKGMAIGAGAASAGYLLRWAGENWLGWGDAGADNIANKTKNSLPESAPADMMPSNLQGDTIKESDINDLFEKNEGVATSSTNQTEGFTPTESLNEGHELTSNFTIELGQGNVPKNLETVFNAISADHMSLPEAGVDEEYATKSLNMAANMVRLTEGGNVGDIKAADFAQAVEFKDGVLNVKDYVKFNEILDRLEDHSSTLWDNKVLQSKGGAISYLSNLSSNEWLRIVQADGLEGTVAGHDIDITKIKDFSDSELVKSAMENTSGSMSAEQLEETRQALLEKYVRAEINIPETKVPTLEELGIRSNEKLEGEFLDTNLARPEVTAARGQIYDLYDGNLPEAVLQEIKSISKENLVKIFPDETELVWESIQEAPASVLIKTNLENLDKEIKPFVEYLRNLEKVTGLSPKAETLVTPAETNGEFIARALKEAVRLKVLDRVTL